MWSIFLVGLCMGAADLLPGISGGSVAFIGGIYPELLSSFEKLSRGQFSKIRRGFVFPLLAGIFFSVAGLSHLLYFLLKFFPGELYAFFLGVMLVSSRILLKELCYSKRHVWILLVFGVLLTFFQSYFKMMDLSKSLLGIFFASIAGAFAMILPGISGSYLLCLVNVYPRILFCLSHLVEINSWIVLSIFGLGTLLGLLIASHIVKYLLKNFPQGTLAFLAGALLGGLPSLVHPTCTCITLFVWPILGACLSFFLTNKRSIDSLEFAKKF